MSMILATYIQVLPAPAELLCALVITVNDLSKLNMKAIMLTADLPAVTTKHHNRHNHSRERTTLDRLFTAAPDAAVHSLLRCE
jgi:hypothetical protein